MVDVVVNPTSKTAKEFAYVRFAQAEAAQRAIDELDGTDLDGLEIGVFWQSASTRPGKELLIRFLPFDVPIRITRDLFSEHGRLTNVHISRHCINGEQIAYAHVQFLHESDAERATDALDGHAMSRGPIRIDWAKASMPSGLVVRVVDLDEIVDRRMLKKVFSRYGGLRRVRVDYDRSTGRSVGKAFLTFAGPEEVQEVVKYFGGYFFRNGEALISLPIGRLNRELEQIAAAETATCPRASGSASPGTEIPDLLTDSVIHVTASTHPEDASVDLIDLSAPSPPTCPSAVVSPVEVGHIYAEKRDCEIPVHFYAEPESGKLMVATQILMDGFYAEQDFNNNESDECNTKVTLVARSTPELVAAMDRINDAGIDCWMCDDPSIRGGHSFQPSELMTVNVAMAPVCSKIKYSQHVVFLSPTDDPEDMGAAMDVMMLEHTDVNLVSVLFDESDDEQRFQVSQMMNLLR